MIPKAETIDMITLADLKALIPLTKTDNDDYLTMLIKGYSEHFADEMDRYTKKQSRTEYLDAEHGQSLLWLKGWPFALSGAVPDVRIWNDSGTPPTWATELTINEDFVAYDREDKHGRVRFKNAYIIGGYQVLKVTWDGGMAADTAAFDAAYHDIVMALVSQITFHWRQRDKTDVAGLRSGGSSVDYTKFRELALQPHVEQVLNKYKRGF